MNWKKSGMRVVFLVLLGALLASCSAGDDEPLTIDKVWNGILSLGSLEFLGYFPDENALTAFMRIMIGILVFTILFEVGRLTGTQSKAIGVIAGILAIISIIFIPGTILAGIGAAYGTLVSFVLIGTPVMGGLYLIYVIPSDNRWRIGLKLVLIAILIWILIAVKDHAITLLEGFI